jgi:hypothetical protein
MSNYSWVFRGSRLAVAILFGGVLGCADVFQVSLNTTPLIGHPAEPFSIFFSLLDGSGTGDGNTTVTLSNFAFGGGGAPFEPASNGPGTSGDLTSSVTLNDSDPVSDDFSQEFTQGTQFNFEMNVTTTGSDVDTFLFGIIDSSGNLIPTLDPLGEDVLLRATISGSGTSFSTFPTDPTQDTAAFQQPPIDMTAPVVTPEPSMKSPAVAAMLLLVLFSVVRSRQKRFPRHVPKYQTIA